MAAPDKLAALGRAVAEVTDEAIEGRARPPIDQRLAALRARKAQGAAREGSLRRPVAIGLLLGAAAAIPILWPGPAPLTFALGEPTTAGAVGAWIVAPPAETRPIAFSDGTRVRLEGGARVRVLGVTAHGARVAIERGALRADVIPRAGNEWSVVGGPFEIHVTGTSFDAGWDPDTEMLRVVMHEGRVVVRAACLDRERTLSAGESASLSCAPPREASRAAAPVPSSSPSADRATPRSIAPRAVAATAEAPAPSVEPTAVAPAASWREPSRRGDYKGALAAAESEGFGALVESLGAAELFELATTARLAGRSARAAEAYSAVRRRFGGGDAAANAAFHLGQMAFDGARSYGEAHRWFSVYLAERPGGALAAEALGRTMEAEQRSGDLAAARATAQRYLARYPGGAHADLAKSLISP